MKILFISHTGDRSGAPIALLQELQHIKDNQKEIQADVLMLRGGVLLDEFKELFPVLYGNNKTSLFSRARRKLGIKPYIHLYLNLFKRNEYDCIYANTIASFNAAILIKKKLNIPLIGHVHESESMCRSFGATEAKFKYFDAIITVSEFTKRDLISNYNYPAEKITIQHPFSTWVKRVINNEVQIKPVKCNSNNFIVGLFCYGRWQKALETLPFLVNIFQKKYPNNNVLFNVIGNIPKDILYHTTYDLKRMNLADKIMWAGGVDNPLDYHAGFDVFLLLSREDSFPLAAEEAAVTETPIIGFQGATGAAEWIKDGAGILVPYMDFNALADAIYQLYSDGELRKTFGKRGKEIITQLYHEDSKMKSVYDAVYGFSKSK